MSPSEATRQQIDAGKQRSGYNPIAPVEASMSAQQLQALQKDMAARLADIRKDVELRKWAVDQACGLTGSALEFAKEPIDVMLLARSIHKFLTENTT